MASITKLVKHKLVLALVMDAVRRRVENLRDDVHDHWVEVGVEILDAPSIILSNSIVNSIGKAPELAGISLDVSISRYTKPTFVTRNETVMLTTATPGDVDPLSVKRSIGVQSDVDYETSRTITKAIDAIWEEGDRLSFDLPVPLAKLVEIEDEDNDYCSMDDEVDNSTAFMLDLDTFVPEDCTTKKRFHKRAKKLGNDISKLYGSIFNNISTCRSDVAIIAAVPELKMYIAKLEKAQSEVSSLLTSVRDGE